MASSASSNSLITDFSFSALRAVGDDYDAFWASDAWDFTRVPEDDRIKPDPRTQEDGVKRSDQLTLIHRFFPAYKDVCRDATGDAKKWKALAVKIIMVHPLFKHQGVKWVRYYSMLDSSQQV
jgi:hypothetical protein